MQRIFLKAALFSLTSLNLVLLTYLPVFAELPTVVSTYPINGQNGVDLNLPQIILNFSKPMQSGYSMKGLGPYYSGFVWSANGQTLTIVRDSEANPYDEGNIVNPTLNPPPYYSFKDTEDNSLGTYMFSFTASASSDPEAPTVLSTSPENGATDVEADIQFVSITFSKAMSTNRSISSQGNWQLSETTPATWSPDGLTLTISRDNASSALAPLTVIRLILNPIGSGFEDTQGRSMGTYSFAFTIRAPAAHENPTVISTNPIQSIEHPVSVNIRTGSL